MEKVTSSLKFPNMFDITHNSVNVLTGNAAIVNRDRLLILSNPGELYNNPNFGVGLPKYLWTYNTVNTRAMMREDIKHQLSLHEHYVSADETQFSDKLLSEDTSSQVGTIAETENSFNMTVGLQTVYADDTQLDLNIEIEGQKITTSIVQDNIDINTTI